MFGLSGLGLKLAIVGIIVAIIAATVGGFFMYQKSIVGDLNDIITTKQKLIDGLKEQISGLIIDKERLQTSNDSLESEITRKVEETKEAFAEITRLREADIASVTRLNEIERRLRDRNRMEVLESIRQTRKASLLLRLMDRNVACYAENFDNVEGKCIRGRWVPTGERFLPEVSTEVTPNE